MLILSTKGVELLSQFNSSEQIFRLMNDITLNPGSCVAPIARMTLSPSCKGPRDKEPMLQKLTDPYLLTT